MESLGHVTRLEIFRTLIRAGRSGTPVGTIQQQLAIPGSTLSHHIKHLVDAGLVSQNRHGRSLVCCANYSTMNELLTFLTDECCADEVDRNKDCC